MLSCFKLIWFKLYIIFYYIMISYICLSVDSTQRERGGYSQREGVRAGLSGQKGSKNQVTDWTY